MSRIALIAVSAAMLFVGTTQAAITPLHSANDPRIRIVEYVPDQVVTLKATLGYVVTVMFGEGERIENVSIGDSLGWQVTPNRKANLLFLKPVELSPATNMTVVTNLRTYTLDLQVRRKTRGDERSVIFALKFDYPAPVLAMLEPVEAPKPPEPPKDLNKAYSYKGSGAGLPLRVFDDGSATYFEFAENTEYPAIFAVDEDHEEATVNVSQRDGLLVIDRLASAFILRRGAEVSQIINEAFRPNQGQLTTLLRHKGR